MSDLPDIDPMTARLAYRDAAGAWCSEGRRRLEVARGKTHLKGFAGSLHLTPQFVGRLLAGRQVPSIEVAMQIWLRMRIPVHTWAIAPGREPIGSTTESRDDEGMPRIGSSSAA